MSTDEEILPDEEIDTTDVSVLDNTVEVLRSWGLSGEPITWAPTRMQPVIAITREVNKGFGDLAAVQAMLDATYGAGVYDAADVALAHPPTAEFSATGTDPEVHCVLTTDADLDLPGEMVEWDYGDGFVTRGTEATHTYTAVGDYVIRCTLHVAGVAYTTTQDHEITEIPDPEPVPDPEEQGLPGHPSNFTIAQIQDWVDEHPHLAADVLAHEEARGSSARSTLLDWLRGFVESHDGVDAP